ncbi:hypothetical protein F2P81_016488 [Scophthalmus maximus]|uniref:Uncharacterized protein n=1 Tax=Scophthalmus maximus TaxID=52904 RepID=A0A6A4SCQ0_SCOMX|nr:hypothetical protein F2P81_016488 [Scophthalmus maximus]
MCYARARARGGGVRVRTRSGPATVRRRAEERLARSTRCNTFGPVLPHKVVSRDSFVVVVVVVFLVLLSRLRRRTSQLNPLRTRYVTATDGRYLMYAAELPANPPAAADLRMTLPPSR